MKKHPLPKIAPLPKSKQRCFWCWEALNKRTRTWDHLISGPLWETLVATKHPAIFSRRSCPDRMVLCCWNCNQQRSKITVFYKRMRQLRFAFEGGQSSAKGMARFLRNLQEHFDVFAQMEQRIIAHVKEELAAVLLIEIHELVAFLDVLEKVRKVEHD